ncbi:MULTISPECIES: anion permease [Psychrobacter]|uniref:DASS family sodium-coupled anion symporter n=3 Tax=Psychrobacter TaxID=497 RepID=A0A844LZ91_9GAMM|nr:anion permease [Psychrobacter sanguinis]MUG31865.1 DASS family sodium-coupled anion symporter [Psychrobacter sanguinis]
MSEAPEKFPFKLWPTLIAIAVGLIIWFVIPTPEGVTDNAWHLLALFVATIVAIIGKALPIGALAIIGITLVALTGVTAETPKAAMQDALSSFSSPLIWLIGIAVMISRGLIKTGLGSRIAYYFISIFGKKTLGIGYSLAAAELMIAPITPSNTARGGGIIHPIMRSIALSFHSTPEEGTQNKMGRYLAMVNYHANPITSGMFITATAPNPLVVDLVNKATGSDIHLSWTTWALAMFVPGLLCILIMPLVIYLVYPPEIKETPDAKNYARENLAKLGSVTRQEKIMLAVFALMLLLWANIPALIFGDQFSVDATATAFLGLSVLIMAGVLTWEDVLKEKSAWDTIVWFGALVMMADYLNKLGLISWFSSNIESAIALTGVGWVGAVAILTLVYLYMHYFFASTTAHVTAMFAAFYAVGLSLGAPPMLYALILAAAGNIMMTLTHYATGTAPVIFNSGYTTLKEWWTVGAIMSVVNLVVWIGSGLIWWKVLGYY